MICHITTRQAWETAVTEREYNREKSPGYIPPSLSLEGFIHCSYPEQLIDTARRYFRGQSGLVVLWIDPARLTAELRVEETATHSGSFPHIYGSLNLEAVVKVTEYNPDQE